MFPGYPTLPSSYDHRLVALSVVIAVCASYAALDLAGRVTAARSRARAAWLIGGASAMGLGIWSMHYIGMLAFNLPIPVQYDWPTVLVSLIAAILASAVALYVVSRKEMNFWRAVSGSIVMGTGIATMHYTGMAAMRVAAMCHYDSRLVGLSVILAIVISFVALWLAFLAREESKGWALRKILSATVMGAAIPVMHYTAMAAAHFINSDAAPDLSHSASISTLGTMGITMVTIMILGIAVLTSLFDRRLSAQGLELQSAERRYQLLFEGSLAGIIRTTLDGRILDCNPASARIFGYSSSKELIALPALDRYIHAGDLAAFIARLKTEKKLTNYEHRLKRKDGSPIWLLGSAHLVEDKAGEPSICEETFIDITERKKAEETFQKAFNANPEPIAITTIGEDRYVSVNDSFLRATGYRREDVVGRTSLELGFWGRPEERSRLAGTLRENGTVRDVEITFRTKSREDRTAIYSADVIEVAGRQCCITILRDNTEQKLLESQLRQSQKMEAVGQLSGGIAHDFNNLLGVIIGYSEILEEQLPPGHALLKECGQIKKAGRSAASLTRQLLAFSRQQVLDTRVLDLNSIVVNVEQILRRLIGAHIDLRTALDASVGSIKADQSQIEQVIVNLVVNARDAMPGGGKLMIETTNVDLDEDYTRRHPPQKAGPYVLLTIADTGVGMSAETQSHIFEPFFTTKEQGKGTGLGLSTVYGVVRQSGGHVWVYSEIGRGTTFKIYLPRAGRLARPEKVHGGGAEALRGSETILLAEDNEGLRELTRDILVGSGYTILETDLPENAIEVARQHKGRIHLLLTDMVMPGMDGRALAKALAPMQPDMKVIYMSGYTGFTLSGLDDSEIILLPKPFTKQTLLQRVHEVLELEMKLDAK